MFIKKDPTGEIYESLLDLAFEVCEEFMFIVRINYTLNNKVFKLLKDLEPYLKWCSKDTCWIGTIGSNYAMVYYYYTNNATKEIIKKSSYSLHTWRHPNLPEDLCFVKGGENWLINTSHEYSSQIITDSKDEIERIINMRLVVKLNEEEKKLINC